MLGLFENFKENDKTDAVEQVISKSSPKKDFFLFVILAILMATFGLLKNNIAIIIGSMLIAPVLYPILGLAMGIVMSDSHVIFRSLKTLGLAILVGLIASSIVGLFALEMDFTSLTEIAARESISIMDLAIAFIAGAAASFAMVKPELNETFPGIAISAAIIPPLAVVGIGTARLDWHMISNAFLLFAGNIVGIMFAAILVFSLMNFHVKRNVANKQIKKEEKEEKAENNKLL